MAAFTSPTDADWSAASFLNEIAGAIRERVAVVAAVKAWAVSGAAEALWDGELFVAGDDVQAVAVLSGMQRWVEELADSGHWLPVTSGLPNVDVTPWTWASMRSDIGMGSGWTAYTTHPDESGTAAYRRVQAGDIVGPWVFDELQECLARMSVTTAEVSVANGSGQSGAITDAADRDAAIAGAEANTVNVATSSAGAERYVTTSGDGYMAGQGTGTAIYSLVEPGGITAVVWDLWVDAGGTYDTFDAADSGLSQGWNKAGASLDPSDTAEVGSTSFPSWPPTDETAGFLIEAAAGVVQWLFSHGA